MAVQFNFVVSDGDAENILSFMRAAAAKSGERVQKAMIAGDVSLEKYYRRDQAYILGLADVMSKSTCQVADDGLSQEVQG